MVTLRDKKKVSAKPKSAVEKAKSQQESKKAADKKRSATEVAKTVGKAPKETGTQRQRRFQQEELQQVLQYAVLAKYMMDGGCNKSQGGILVGGERYISIDTLFTMVTALCAGAKDKSRQPIEIVARLQRTARKRVCGAIFGADEIAYSCRTCQVDTTCVTCKDCFMHSDHAGHDVYFQRTTAGSSCDCGDPHAWKPSGFCSKHPGVKANETPGTRKQKLPKAIATAAPIAVDTVVEQIYDSLLVLHNGFELANAMEVFARNIPTSALEELSPPLKQEAQSMDMQSSDFYTSLEMSVFGDRRPPEYRGDLSLWNPSSRSTRHTNETSRSNESSARDATRARSENESKTNGESANVEKFKRFGVHLHTDDVTHLDDTLRNLESTLGMSRPRIRSLIRENDESSDVVILEKELLHCIATAASIAKKPTNVSVLPSWWKSQRRMLLHSMQSLQRISTLSDGLAEVVSEALQKPRTSVSERMDALPTPLYPDKTVKDFLTEYQSKLKPEFIDIIRSVVSVDKTMSQWVNEMKTVTSELYSYPPPKDAATTSNAKVDATFDNQLIQVFIDQVTQTSVYTHHQSIRDGCTDVIRKFSTHASMEGRSSRPSSALDLIVRYDCALSKTASNEVHSLLREHLLDTRFRTSMLESYVENYQDLTNSFLHGLANSRDTVFDFAVQFLTVPPLVTRYTREQARQHPERPEIVPVLLKALETIFNSAIRTQDRVLNVEDAALSSQKYKHCTDNLEYVFNVRGMANELVCDRRNLEAWLASLELLQNADVQTRRGVGESHVEYEPDSWLSMFNLGIRMHSIFPLTWRDFTRDEMRARLLTVAELIAPITSRALNRSAAINDGIQVKKLRAVDEIAGVGGSGKTKKSSVRTVLSYDYNVACQPVSFHQPLHRYLSTSIRHLALLKPDFTDELSSPEAFLKVFGLDQLDASAYMNLIEMPMRALVFKAQIQSKLWRRNGDENMSAQVYNYSALPYCLHYQDADVFLLQLGILASGPDDVLSKLLDRFQLATYFIRPDVQPPLDKPSGSAKKAIKDMDYALLEPGVDTQQALQMLEEFLRLIIVLGTNLPSSVGKDLEHEFLADEMLQHLCAKPSSFSRLFELAILPSGQDDVTIPRLENVLSEVADFVPPSGIEPGRYELKEGLLEKYNPYFLHLNREKHELARDRWTVSRKLMQSKQDPSSPPPEPLQAARMPVAFLRPVQDILTCKSAVYFIQIVLWKVLRAETSTSSVETDVSDAVVSTCLHLVVHGIHTASRSANEEYWNQLCALNKSLDNMSVVHLIYRLHHTPKTGFDSEQKGSLGWIVFALKDRSSACRDLLAQLEEKRSGDEKKNESDGAVKKEAPTLEDRKAQARKRAMDAMAKQQQAFQAMMSKMEDEDETEEKMEAEESSRKRRLSEDTAQEASKRHKPEEEGPKCILCHDSSKQHEMGVTAYVHQSTVLATGFRPDPSIALVEGDGEDVRISVRNLCVRMGLSYGDAGVPARASHIRPFPHVHAWGSDEGFDDEGIEIDEPHPNLAILAARARHRQQRQSPRAARRRGQTQPQANTTAPTPVAPAQTEAMEDAAIEWQDNSSLTPPSPAPEPPTAVSDGESAAMARSLHVRHAIEDEAYDFDSEEDEEEYFATDPFSRRFGGPPGLEFHSHTCVKLDPTPCGLHVRTCQHAVHMSCLDRYITSLHDKAIRGEDFDGVQAIDPDSMMNQFLCPLCKTLCNFLLPLSDPSGVDKDIEVKAMVPVARKMHAWPTVIQNRDQASDWCRPVLGQGSEWQRAGTSAHNQWRSYFESNLWEPHGSLEKGGPFLWPACAFSVASFLLVADKESEGKQTFEPLVDDCPPTLEKELASLKSVTKFCRWSFGLLEHCADAKIVWETARRACPVNMETRRDFRKYTTLLSTVDACLRPTVRGLLEADPFTCFVISSVLAKDTNMIWQLLPVFSAADLLQRLYTEFLQERKREPPLTADKDYREHDLPSFLTSAYGKRKKGPRTRNDWKNIRNMAGRTSRTTKPRVKPRDALHKLVSKFKGEANESYYALLVLQFMAEAEEVEDLIPEELMPPSVKDIAHRLEPILDGNRLLIRRMKMFARCLLGDEAARAHANLVSTPNLQDLVQADRPALEHVWRWCLDRMQSKQQLKPPSNSSKCDHAEGASENFMASLFIVRDVKETPRLIELPAHYDELYSAMSDKSCENCGDKPSDGAVCLLCGDLLCCGDACCSNPIISTGQTVGECTRHAIECGGGVGIVLLLDQCRVAIIGGSMAAHFPCPYVDDHGEEDVGLQRGRPLRLDHARYQYLESLWLHQRIFSEVSRLRNQKEPQYTLHPSVL